MNVFSPVFELLVKLVIAELVADEEVDDDG